MKTKVSLLIGVMIMISVVVFGQVEVRNGSSANIKVKSVDGSKSIDININKSAIVSFLNVEGGVTKCLISHSNFKPGKGFIQVEDGEFILAVTNNKAVFSSPKQRQAVGSQTKSAPKPEKKTTSSAGYSSTSSDTGKSGNVDGSKSTTDSSESEDSSFATFKVLNKCSKTIIGHSTPFTGLCLKSEQTSDKEFEAPTGNLQACFSYDEDADSVATGKNRKWAVLDRAIPEGTSLLEICDSNLVFSNTGIISRKKFDNTTDRGYLIRNDEFKNGKYQVKTIAPNSTQKIDFFLGWNVLSLQYKGDKGFPKQVVIMFLVTEQGGTVKLKETMQNGKPSFEIE